MTVDCPIRVHFMFKTVQVTVILSKCAYMERVVVLGGGAGEFRGIMVKWMYFKSSILVM